MRQGAYSTVHAARCTRHGANSTANMAAAYCTRCMWHDACDDAWGRAHAAPCMQHGACGTMHAIRYIRAAHAARRMRHGACGMAHAVRYMRHGEDGMVHAARRIRHGACGKVHAARCMRHGVYGTVHGCGTAHAARCTAARRMRHGAFSAMHMARRICHGTYRAVYTSRCIRPGAYGPVHRQTRRLSNRAGHRKRQGRPHPSITGDGKARGPQGRRPQWQPREPAGKGGLLQRHRGWPKQSAGHQCVLYMAASKLGACHGTGRAAGHHVLREATCRR